MIVALDGSPFAMTSGGLRRYTEELTRALAEIGASVEVLRPKSRLWWSVRLPYRLRHVIVQTLNGSRKSAIPHTHELPVPVLCG